MSVGSTLLTIMFRVSTTFTGPCRSSLEAPLKPILRLCKYWTTPLPLQVDDSTAIFDLNKTAMNNPINLGHEYHVAAEPAAKSKSRSRARQRPRARISLTCTYFVDVHVLVDGCRHLQICFQKFGMFRLNSF